MLAVLTFSGKRVFPSVLCVRKDAFPAGARTRPRRKEPMPKIRRFPPFGKHCFRQARKLVGSCHFAHFWRAVIALAAMNGRRPQEKSVRQKGSGLFSGQPVLLGPNGPGRKSVLTRFSSPGTSDTAPGAARPTGEQAGQTLTGLGQPLDWARLSEVARP